MRTDDGVCSEQRRIDGVEQEQHPRTPRRTRRARRCRVLARSMLFGYLLVSSDAAERFASTSALERCVHEVQKRSAAFISRYFAKKKLDLAELTY